MPFFFNVSLEGLLGDLWTQKELSRVAGDTFGPCLPMFREARPFLQKVASETQPGRIFDDLGVILMPFGDDCGYISCYFCILFAGHFPGPFPKWLVGGSGNHGGG